MMSPSSPGDRHTAQERPNVLWICTDEQRYDTLGCCGNPFVHTPNLDRLAQEGVLFESCYCQSPICSPSRASFLTGRYPRTTRCRQNGQAIPADELLITRILAEAGYLCGLSGKLHLSPCHPAVCPALERRIDDGYAEFHWSHHPDAGYWPTNEYVQWLEQKGMRHGRAPFRGSPYVHAGMPAELHQTTWCAEKAIEFIEAHAQDRRPWLSSVNTFAPHHPFDPPAEYLERYLDRLDDLPLPNYAAGELENKPPFQKADHRAAYNEPGNCPFDDMTPEDHRLVRAAYWATVDLIDAQVGRVLNALERTGQRRRTIVIFMSDHGEMLGDHGIYLKGPYFYEPLIRVPLLISWPGKIEHGRRYRALVELTDLAPTLLDALRLPMPPGMQGRSFWDMITRQSPADSHREDVYCEYYNALATHTNPTAQATMVRTERYKLAAVHGMDAGELYDLRDDPGETHNLWHSPVHEKTKTAMLKRLCDRMAWTVDPLPLREATY